MMPARRLFALLKSGAIGVDDATPGETRGSLFYRLDVSFLGLSHLPAAAAFMRSFKNYSSSITMRKTGLPCGRIESGMGIL